MLKKDIYTIIHKAQRAHLFNLCSKIGRTDFSNSQEAEEVKKEVREMIQHLREHSHNEHTFIHPLFLEVGDQAGMIDEEHDELEAMLLKLEEILLKGRWEKLYPEFNRFIANYLLHQDGEERAQEEILWKYFDQERIAGVLEAFKASRPPEKGLEDLKFVIPHLNMHEILSLFNAIKD